MRFADLAGKLIERRRALRAVLQCKEVGARSRYQCSIGKSKVVGFCPDTPRRSVQWSQSVVAGCEVFLFDRKDLAGLDFDVVDDAHASGIVGQFGVVDTGRHAGDAQPFIGVDRAVLVVLALIGRPSSTCLAGPNGIPRSCGASGSKIASDGSGRSRRREIASDGKNDKGQFAHVPPRHRCYFRCVLVRFRPHRKMSLLDRAMSVGHYRC